MAPAPTSSSQASARKVNGSAAPNKAASTSAAATAASQRSSSSPPTPIAPLVPSLPFPSPDFSVYPHPVLSRLHGVVTGWWLFLVVLLSSLLTNALQLTALALVFLPLHTRLSLSQSAASLWWLLFPFSTEVWSSIPLLITGSLPHPSDTSLFIGNHAPGLDFPVGVSIASLPPSPGTGRVMTMLKRSLAFVPTIGFTHFLQGSLFLARAWERDEGQIRRKMEDMREGRFPRPFWIGVYPEGTRLTAEKRMESQAFSKERSLPVFEHVLFPRTKGFVYLLRQLRPILSSLLNATTSYTGGGLYLSHPLLHGRFTSHAIHVHLTRTDIAQLPDSEEEQQRWLYSAFQEKDRLLQHFAEHGRFPHTGPHAPLWQPPVSRYHRLTAVFVGWSALLSLAAGLLLGWSWAAGGALLTALTVLRPMLIGGLFDVVGQGRGLLGSRRSKAA